MASLYRRDKFSIYLVWTGAHGSLTLKRKVSSSNVEGECVLKMTSMQLYEALTSRNSYVNSFTYHLKQLYKLIK